MAKWQIDTPAGQSYVVEADTFEEADAAVTNAPNAFAGGFDESQDSPETAAGMTRVYRHMMHRGAVPPSAIP